MENHDVNPERGHSDFPVLGALGPRGGGSSGVEDSNAVKPVSEAIEGAHLDTEAMKKGNKGGGRTGGPPNEIRPGRRY